MKSSSSFVLSKIFLRRSGRGAFGVIVAATTLGHAAEEAASEAPSASEAAPAEPSAEAHSVQTPSNLEEVPPSTEPTPLEGAASSPAEDTSAASPVASAASPVASPSSPTPEPPPPDPNSLPYTYHQKHFDVQVTFGPGWLTDSGVEPYSSGEGVALLGARLGGAPLSVGRFAFALLAEGTYGSVSGTVRGSRSSLELGILALGLEARYHFHHLSYAFVRVSPGATYAQASVTDASTLLSGDGFQPAVAGHLGAAVRIAGPADGRERAPRVWLMLEVGYRYTGDYGLVLRAPEESPVDAAELMMPSFSLVGPDASVGVAITF